MDERIAVFIESLKKHLEGLPEQEVREAVSYYEEYLYDAAEAGKDPEEVFKQLDPPEKIAGMLRTETSILRAQKSPGLRNFTSVLRNAFRSVTTPLAVFLVSIFIVASYSVVLMLFGGALVSFIAGIVMALGMVYQALTMSAHFPMEIAGAVGMGLFGAGICLLLSFALYKLARLLIRVSSRFIGKTLRKPGKPAPELENQPDARPSGSRRHVLICLAVIVAGFMLTAVSGLPVRYFTIFNSMKPENVITRTTEYDAGGINKISLVTAHSRIKVTSGNSDKIVLSYEQPDWLDYEAVSSGSMLSFYERSNGRLPLFPLVKLHESITELTVSIPRGYSPEIIMLESTGGDVSISGLAENIEVKTMNGDILFNPEGVTDSYNIRANTGSGTIVVGGVPAGQKGTEGIEYYRDAKAAKTVKLNSSGGRIVIKSEAP